MRWEQQPGSGALDRRADGQRIGAQSDATTGRDREALQTDVRARGGIMRRAQRSLSVFMAVLLAASDGLRSRVQASCWRVRQRRRDLLREVSNPAACMLVHLATSGAAH